MLNANLPSGPYGGDTIDEIATALETSGYLVLPSVFSEDVLQSIFIHFKSLDEERFRTAGIGREDVYHVNQFVRTDEIFWLDRTIPAVNAYFDWIEELRLGLNRRLFLGLFDYECHYAYYPTGAFYKKHLDAFKGEASRVVTTVLYLNPNWLPQDSGELLLYNMEGDLPIERIEPQFGKMVIFLSEDFPHEVLPVNKPRYSIAGWYRVNTSSTLAVDPPQ
ncbi:MAG: proline hydroxylase [Sedimenticola sp.]|jgi:SM-20-related protein|nr:MAG: proline hydroxylase [Sedimenticola sp.]